ncbi:hypothetical protein Btru_016750 [Bulinus truncatus]|nr:hypothetical protein Btru_016750 [Bulinus truncatus]
MAGVAGLDPPGSTLSMAVLPDLTLRKYFAHGWCCRIRPSGSTLSMAGVAGFNPQEVLCPWLVLPDLTPQEVLWSMAGSALSMAGVAGFNPQEVLCPWLVLPDLTLRKYFVYSWCCRIRPSGSTLSMAGVADPHGSTLSIAGVAGLDPQEVLYPWLVLPTLRKYFVHGWCCRIRPSGSTFVHGWCCRPSGSTLPMAGVACFY